MADQNIFERAAQGIGDLNSAARDARGRLLESAGLSHPIARTAVSGGEIVVGGVMIAGGLLTAETGVGLALIPAGAAVAADGIAGLGDVQRDVTKQILPYLEIK